MELGDSVGLGLVDGRLELLVEVGEVGLSGELAWCEVGRGSWVMLWVLEGKV